ncbi:MAG: TPM domain-containing protein [Polyangiaceae bacterium]
MSILNTADEAAIQQRIGEIEQKTAGELLVVTAPRSSGYDRARAQASALVTFALAVLTYLFVPHIPGVWVLCGQAPLFVGLYWLAALPPITRALVAEGVQRQKVAARARQLFVEQGITETRDRSGVLVYLSEVEHRIEILADRGVHQRVGAEGWQRMVDGVVSAIQRGQAGQGVLAAIDAIGLVLTEHFPRRADDVNELSDTVVRVT